MSLNHTWKVASFYVLSSFFGMELVSVSLKLFHWNILQKEKKQYFNNMHVYSETFLSHVLSNAYRSNGNFF